MSNNEIRQSIIKRRKQEDLSYRFEAAEVIINKLISTDYYSAADKILIYADASGEVPTDKLILRALLDGKEVYAPLCGEDFSMEFYRIHDLGELYPHHYGIREPLEIEYLKLNEVTNNTIIVVPGVAFDMQGHRIGYGKGYYDRYLSRFNINHRIGFAYEYQIVDNLEINATDITMTEIITN